MAAIVLVVGAAAVGAGVYVSSSQTSSTAVGATSGAVTGSSSSRTTTAMWTINGTSSALGFPMCPFNDSSLLGIGEMGSSADLFGGMSSPVGAADMNATAAQLFGNFSQMTVSMSLPGSLGGLGGPVVDSYAVVGRPLVGSLRYYEVNFTEGVGGLASVSSTAWFAPNGTATSVTSGMMSGFGSPSETGYALVAPFLVELELGSIAKGAVASPAFTMVNHTSVSLGANTVKVTYYALNSASLASCGASLTKFVVGLGTVPGTRLPLAISTDLQGSMSLPDMMGNDQAITFEMTVSVASLTVAGR